MDDSGNVTKNSQEDVEEKIRVASSLKKDSERREDDGKTIVWQSVHDSLILVREERRAYMILQMSEAVKGILKVGGI